MCYKPLTSERSPYDAEPYYCTSCGLGYAEFLACEDDDCALEHRDLAEARAEKKKGRLEQGE